MWSALFALIQSVPIFARILEKLMPTRGERQTDKIRNDKQHERKNLDAWVDRSSQ